MNRDISTDLLWYLVTIDDDPRLLTGEAFFEMIKLIQDTEGINFVVFDEIDAVGKNNIFSFLHENVDEVFEVQNVLKLTKDIDHVEWGDFFLFKEYPKDWDNPGDWYYPYLIAQADTTLRAVDDQYMYIYTQSARLVDMLRSKYELESVKIDLLEKLDFPY